MYTVYLMGGLGNQLFQFAAAYAYSKKNGCHIEVDLSYLKRCPAHGGYRLDRLELGRYIYKDKISGILKHVVFRAIMREPKISLLTNGRVVHEKFFSTSKINHIISSNNVTLLGYWQDSNLFSQYHGFFKSNIIPKVKTEQSNSYQKMIENAENSVSIHVRRGDYVNNAAAFETHGVCSVSYYRNAISLIREKIVKPHFFVFTNDPLWVNRGLEDIFADVEVTFVEGNSQEEDLWLMSQAKHHIIANSSFSWWGAWLAKHDMQMVISPEPWYDNPPQSSNDPSLIDWIRLPK
ncbi:alpha-1,2-fucosyltransferase [Aeromonas veronii]|uniref:alpha-1,2-fucosyltransferase n=1 Tax=Aeromonas veronii TaxID=654 RepID=UPI001327B492|nr:alpha-1,2-fucosyltransferase [Aeromonas veronii]MCF5767175.1 alpha-1,2-fucosyltransferase [Aeromonas veronii]MXV28892.1 alpha-1,2-fucosyltransferase [Aeromonas veronii]